MKLSPKLNCPSRRGARLVPGNMLQKECRNFVPKGKVMVLGFSTFSFACLDCGYLGVCLSEEDRYDLEKKVKDA